MPSSYEIDPALELVRSRAWGLLTEEESIVHYRELANDPAFRPTYRQTCDLRNVDTMDLSAAALRGLARTSVFAPGVKRAFIAEEDAHFGLSRMLQAFFEFEGTEIGVFRTMEEAEQWLNLPPG